MADKEIRQQTPESLQTIEKTQAEIRDQNQQAEITTEQTKEEERTLEQALLEAQQKEQERKEAEGKSKELKEKIQEANNQ